MSEAYVSFHSDGEWVATHGLDSLREATRPLLVVLTGHRILFHPVLPPLEENPNVAIALFHEVPGAQFRDLLHVGVVLGNTSGVAGL